MTRINYFIFCSGLIFFSFGCRDAHTVPQQPLTALTGNPAIDGLSREIAQAPDQPDLYAQRGYLFYENEAYDEAIKDFQSALQYDSANVEYMHLLADVYLDYYKSYDALKVMEKAAKLYPERIPTLLKLSEFQLILQQYPASMQTAGKVMQLDPQNAEGFFMLGMNYKEMGDDARAINSFQSAVENNPDIVDAWINLGQLQAKQNNPIAARYFDTAVQLDTFGVDALHAKAQYLSDKDDLKGAIQVYKTIIERDPQYEEAFFNSGLLYLDLDSVQQAYNQFNTAVQIAPADPDAYYYRGLSAAFAGKIDQARRDYQQAIQLNADHEKAKEALAQLPL